MIRVLIAEDQGLMRTSLQTLLDLEDDIEVQAVVGDGTAALEHLRRDRPDVALLDIEMPGMTGLEVLAACTAEQLPCRCLIITTFTRPGHIRRAMDAGAKGFFIKDGPISDLVDAIRDVAAGRTAISGELAVAALDTPPNPLTAREIDVLRTSTDGRTIQQIADALFLSHSTVRNYLSDAIGKTGTANRTAARQLAERNGWL